MEKIILLLIIWISFLVVITNLKKIEQVFHLTDKRPLISCSEAYTRLNALMEQAEVSLYTFESYDESTSIYLSVEFKGKNESVKGSFKGKDINNVINQAYEWSVGEGLIK